ncbi:Phospholipase YtpA [Gimesia panareensis]|uniref:Phospholipase YtpA n=1 Tax=Gimesia panareensis TaxID=2527978 RepID=A0A517Q4X9_9PLAN|nr:alpha/beta fold hydrolase [Gimesia panareensis]QDT26676.1 Phospholipase YtpA [Gimesia panareensis]
MVEPVIQEFAASDNYRLKGRVWIPEKDSVRGTLVVLHGIQSHSGWYEASCRQLCEEGYQVFFFDRRGSGLNREQRGDAPHWQRLVQDVVQILTWVRADRASGEATPLILQAMSWGAKLAVVVASLRPDLMDGVALLYPGIKARIRPNSLQKLQLKLAEKLGVRQKRVEIPLNDPVLFTGDPGWQSFIRNDPLALHEVTVSFLLANRELDRLVDRSAEQMTCPVFCQLAGNDQIIDHRATEAWFHQIRSEHKRLISYPSARHTLEFEPQREQIVADYADWLAGFAASAKI